MYVIDLEFENVRRTFASFNGKEVLPVQGRGESAVNLTGIEDRPSPYRAVNALRLGYKNQSMLYREITAVCSDIHTKHINTLCGQNVDFVNVKLAVYEDPVRPQ